MSTAWIDRIVPWPAGAAESWVDSPSGARVYRGEDLLNNTVPPHARVVVEDAAGNRFVLVPEDLFHDLQRSASTTGRQDLGTSGRQDGRHLDLPLRREAATLTSRERQVLQLAAAGQPGSATARQLGLACNTVAQHLAAVRRKYGVRSTAAAVAIAQRAGHID